MLTRLKIKFIVVSLAVINWLLDKLQRSLAYTAISEIEKAIEGKSRIITFEPSCLLDETMGDSPCRESLKTWQHRSNVT